MVKGNEFVELGSVTEWLSGGTPTRSIESYWRGEIPWISASTLQVTEIVTSDQCVTPEAVVSGSKMAPINSTLLLVRGSALHKEIRAGIVRKPVCFNQDVKALIPNQKIHPKYLTYSILGRESELLKLVSSAGNTAGVLDTKLVQSFRIWVPNLEEQRAIATALSDVDALLEGLDRLIAKKRDLKQAAMQQLLTGQTRLPGFEGEWEVKTLIELAARKKELFDDGDWIESEHITTEGVRLVQTGNIGIGKFIETQTKRFIYETSFTKLRCKELRVGDLLICRLADPAGRACVLPDISEERIVTSVDVTIFRPPHETADRFFLAYVFSTPEWFRSVSDRSGGTTHKRISRGALGRIAIKLPPRDEQTAIATVLSDMDAEIDALEQRRTKTAALKQAMMQELLTGRTRLV